MLYEEHRLDTREVATRSLAWAEAIFVESSNSLNGQPTSLTPALGCSRPHHKLQQRPAEQ